MAEIAAANTEQPLAQHMHTVDPLAEAIAIMARLRGPGGCPWDREQTFDSIKRHTLEETYEVFDAIERRAWPELKDELGDLLLQVLFYAQMAAEAGYFDILDVAANLNAKLIRRHPHIFPVDGQLADAADAKAVLRNWEQIKRVEKLEAAAQKAETGPASGLDDIPRTMPAMLEAGKLGSRAAKVGFDWPDSEGLFAKLQEEIAELHVEAAKADKEQYHRVEEELGDLLFTTVNLARHIKVDTESALRFANAKFRARFRAMEAVAGGYDALALLGPAELDALWNRAKRAGDSAESKGTPR
jgi:XTP/dITP diphosphohydrolase/ATP diphosphatase